MSTYPTKAAATKAARRARSLLNKPKGWRLNVKGGPSWGRDYYHFTLHSGPLSLHTGMDGSFFALLADNPDHSGMGSMLWSGDHYHHANPNRVIAHQVRATQAVIARIARVGEHIATLV